MSNSVQLWLKEYLAEMGAVAGTVHVHRDGGLDLSASVNIPPVVVDKVRHVPYGKGMAGLALEHNKPIQTCNLQEDETGQVKPGARAVHAKGAVAFPIHRADGSIRAVIGLAYSEEKDLSDEVVARISEAAANCPNED